jgi:hypothetical protein
MSTEIQESSDGLELLDETQSPDAQLSNEDAPVHVIIDRNKDEVRIRMRYPVAVFGAIGLVFLMLFSMTSLVWIVCRKPSVITVERPPTPYLAPVPAQPVAISVGDMRRPGVNYVIIQSFDEEADAAQLAKRVQQHGIACTVEKNLPGWSGRKNAFSVVGQTGFETVKDNQDFAVYIDSLRNLKVDPKPYKWRGPQSELTAAQ